MEEILQFKKINSDILPELREFSNSLSFSLREKEGAKKGGAKKEDVKKEYIKKDENYSLHSNSHSNSHFAEGKMRDGKMREGKIKETEKKNITLLLNKVCEKNLYQTVADLKNCETENLFEEIKKRLHKSTAQMLALLCVAFYEKSVLLNSAQALFEENEPTEGIMLFIKTLYDKQVVSNRIFKYCAEKMLKKDIDLFLLLTPSFFKNTGAEQTDLRKKIKELTGITMRHKFLLEDI